MLRIVAISFLVLSPILTVAAQESGSAPIEHALILRANGNSEQAADVVRTYLIQSPDELDAQILLCKILLQDLGADGEAETILKETLKQNPDNLELKSLDLLHRFRNPPLLLPNLHFVRIRNTAGGILDLDPQNNIAHYVLGSLDTDRFTSLNSAVSMPGFSESTFDGIDVAVVEPVLSGGNNRKKVQYQARGLRNERELNAVSRSASAEEHYQKAEDHLVHAIDSYSRDKHSYAKLTQLYVVAKAFGELESLTAAMVRERSEDPDGYLYAGLALYSNGKVDEAAKSFEEGIRLLPPDEASLFQDVSGILTDEQQKIYEADARGFADTFWLLNDPRYLTSNNERELEHYARLVYADVRFGSMFKGTRGWQTEPGQVIVRYGIPSAESQMSTKTDSYLMMVYPEFGFRFMDLAKAGKYTFFSPKASGAPSFEAIRRAWNDDTIRSAEYFRESPQISRYTEGNRRRDVDYAMAFFRNEETIDTDIVVSMEIPADSFRGSADVSTGVFLLKDGDMTRSLAAAHIEKGWQNVVSHSITASEGTGLISIEYDSDGQNPVGFDKSAVNVPAFRSQPAISSLVVADLIEEGIKRDEGNTTSMNRNGHAISPSVSGRFVRGVPMYVYFEVYNLARARRGDHAFLVEAFLMEDRKEKGAEYAIKKLEKRNSGRGVAVSFERAIPYPNESVYLAIETQNADPGPHVVVIRIIDQTTGNNVYTASPVYLQ